MLLLPVKNNAESRPSWKPDWFPLDVALWGVSPLQVGSIWGSSSYKTNCQCEVLLWVIGGYLHLKSTNGQINLWYFVCKSRFFIMQGQTDVNPKVLGGSKEWADMIAVLMTHGWWCILTEDIFFSAMTSLFLYITGLCVADPTIHFQCRNDTITTWIVLIKGPQ